MSARGWCRLAMMVMSMAARLLMWFITCIQAACRSACPVTLTLCTPQGRGMQRGQG